MDVNPYEAPREASPQVRAPPTAPGDGRAWLFIIPSVAGAIAGGILLASFVRGPGDPTGQSIGAGLGGFSGLLIGFLLRFTVER